MKPTLRDIISEMVDAEDGKKISLPMVWTFHRDRYFEPDGNGDFVHRGVSRLMGVEGAWLMNIEVESDESALKKLSFDLIANYDQDDRPLNIIVDEWQNDPNVERC